MKRSSDIRSWGATETRCLISIWAEDSVQRRLDDSYRNRAIYEDISRLLAEQGYSRSWQQCQRKIKHLKLSYRKAKENNNKPGRDAVSCPCFEELDEVLRDRPSLGPIDGDVLDSADTFMSNCTETIVSVTEESEDEETPGDNNEVTSGSEVAAPASVASNKRKKVAARAVTRRKKSRFESTLEAFTKALSDSSNDELMLKMQQAQHRHEEKLFGMMMQSIASLASAQHPPGPSAP